VQQHPRTGYLLTGCAAVAWALTSPGLKYLLVNYQVPPLTLAFWRDAFIAVVCVAALLLLRRGLLRIRPRDLGGFAIVGAISIGMYHALWVWSISLNGAAVAVVLIYLFPTFVSIGAWLLYHEPLRWQHVVALVVSLAGCALLVRVYDPDTFRVSWLGALVGLLTALTHTVYVLFSQRAVQSYSPWTSLTYTMLFGSLTLLALVLCVTPAQTFAVGQTATPWLLLLCVALGPTLGGYAIFTQALRHIPGRVASLIAVIEAPISTVLAVLLVGETLAWPQTIGMFLILGAIGLPRLLGVRAETGGATTGDQVRTVGDGLAANREELLIPD
jgi:drug/metabolite transporter (DMT)-like permease